MVSFVIGIMLVSRPAGGWVLDAQAILTGLVLIAELIIIVTYQMVSLSSRWQATPGKRVCGIHVLIRTDGRKIGPGAAIGRHSRHAALGR